MNHHGLTFMHSSLIVRSCADCTIRYAHDCSLIPRTDGSIEGYRRIFYFWSLREQSVSIYLFYPSALLDMSVNLCSLIVLGLVIGAILTSFASWPWVFYFMSILGILESIAVFFLCPAIPRPKSSTIDKAKRFKRLDVVGVSLVTGTRRMTYRAVNILVMTLPNSLLDPFHLRGHFRRKHRMGASKGNCTPGHLHCGHGCLFCV